MDWVAIGFDWVDWVILWSDAADGHGGFWMGALSSEHLLVNLASDKES